MAAGLRRLGVEFEEIDVDSDPRLDELYGEDVPVLFKDETELCRHRLTPEAIRQLTEVRSRSREGGNPV
jgi:hypothetical protein